MVKKKASKARKRAARKKGGSGRRKFLFKLAAVSLLLLVCVLVYIDAKVRYTFAARKWAVPARVYARPLELYQGMVLKREDFDYLSKLAIDEGSGYAVPRLLDRPSVIDILTKVAG